MIFVRSIGPGSEHHTKDAAGVLVRVHHELGFLLYGALIQRCGADAGHPDLLGTARLFSLDLSTWCCEGCPSRYSRRQRLVRASQCSKRLTPGDTRILAGATWDAVGAAVHVRLRWWVYTGQDYLTKDAPQIAAIWRMVEQLAERPVDKKIR
jgi:hypothetical protein